VKRGRKDVENERGYEDWYAQQ